MKGVGVKDARSHSRTEGRFVGFCCSRAARRVIVITSHDKLVAVGSAARAFAKPVGQGAAGPQLILFRDTSAWVNRYEAEPGSEAVLAALQTGGSIQLASAQTLRQVSGEDGRFACFDPRLSRAAGVLGLRLMQWRLPRSLSW